MIQKSYVAGLQEKQAAWENRIIQEKQQINNSSEMKECRRQEAGAKERENKKQSSFLAPFNFPFARKKPGLLEKLAGELDAGQIAEIRLGIEDGLTEGQLTLLADKAMDAEKIRELRMTMKILNERGQSV